MAWVMLAIAVIAEVAATIALKLVSEGGRLFWYVVCGAGYILAFVMLSFILRQGFPLGVAYGLWSAGGVAITALVSHLMFDERFTRRMLLGIFLIIVGVMVVEIGRVGFGSSTAG